MIVKFLGIDCKVEFERYQFGGGTAIQLVGAHDDEEHDIHEGEPITDATVNICGVPLESDEVVIKNYSENEGVLEALEAAGVVRRTGRTVETGFVSCPVCKLLVKE